MTDQSIRTTAGETFTGEESARMAALVYKRFGNDILAATHAWRRLLRNSCSESQFARLVAAGRRLA